jgi:hypothetical protein
MDMKPLSVASVILEDAPKLRIRRILMVATITRGPDVIHLGQSFAVLGVQALDAQGQPRAMALFSLN